MKKIKNDIPDALIYAAKLFFYLNNMDNSYEDDPSYPDSVCNTKVTIKNSSDDSIEIIEGEVLL